MANIVELIIRGNDQSAKAIASSVKGLQGMDSALGSISRQLSGILSIGALASLAKSAIDLGSSLDDASKKFGVSASELSALQYVAKLSGVEFEDLGGAFKFLSKAIAESQNPSSDAAIAFKAMGVSIRDSKGNLKGTDALFMELADAFAGMKDGANKTALALAIFGRAGANILPVMADGAAGINKLKNEAKALGATLTEEEIKNLDAYGDAIDKIGMVAKSTAGRLMMDMGDAVKWLFRQNDISLNLVDKLNRGISGLEGPKGAMQGKIADILVPNPEPGAGKEPPNLEAIKKETEAKKKAAEEQKKRLADYEKLHAANMAREGETVHETLAAEMGWTQEYYDTISKMSTQDFEEWKKQQADELELLGKFNMDKIAMLKDLQDAQRAETETEGPAAPYLFEDAMKAAEAYGNVEGAIAIWEQGFGAHTMFLEEAAVKVQAYQDIWEAANQSFSVVAVSIGMAARDQLIGTLTNVVMGAQKASEAFKALGKAILSMIVEAAMKWIVSRLIMAVMGKSIQAAETAASVAMAGKVAAAWAPAAAFTSLASFGSNSFPAMAGLAGTVALATALSVPALAEGGIVNRPTLALIGEKGPEAVIPLDKGGAGQTIVLQLDGEVLARWLHKASRTGVVRLVPA